jgi:hypothetical protein
MSFTTYKGHQRVVATRLWPVGQPDAASVRGFGDPATGMVKSSFAADLARGPEIRKYSGIHRRETRKRGFICLQSSLVRI